MMLRLLLAVVIVKCKRKLCPTLMDMRLDLRKGSLSVTKSTNGSEAILLEELAMGDLDVVKGVRLREPEPRVLAVFAVGADDGGQLGDIGAGEGAGDHALLHPVNLPDVILDAGKSQRCDADTSVLENNIYCLV